MLLPTPKPLRDAETDFVWVIVPFSRPENIDLVLSNFNRQKFPFKKLVLVENGAAVGTTSHHQLSMSGALVLTSERHQSIAKNTALQEIKKLGGGFTVVMDDDDWYGPHFLTEACGYARTYDVIGKNRHFVSMDGNLWLCHREASNRKTDWLTGGTIACWAESCPDYPMLRHGEDARFCLTAARLGMSVYGTDVYHYLYRRSSITTHAWRISKQQLRSYEASARALDLGVEDPSIVTGELLDVDGSVLVPDSVPTLVPPSQGDKHVTT